MAQQPNYGALSDVSVEQQKIDRARKYAEMLQAQSMEPTQGQMAGGWYVAPSWTQGAAKMAQALSGAYLDKQADQDSAKLAERVKSEREAADARLVAAASGSPNFAQDPVRLAAALPQWATDAQPDLAPRQLTKDQIKQNVIAAALAHPEARGPALAAYLSQLTANPESQFAKVDPKDYTGASVAKFAQTGNHADLVPVRKKEAVNAGGVTQFFNPYDENLQAINHTATPDTLAKIAQQDKQFNNLSAYQQAELPIQRGNLAVAQGNLGVNRTNSFFNTGMNSGGGVIPQIGAPPNGYVPTQPVIVPRGTLPGIKPAANPQVPPQPDDGLTPKVRAEIAGENAKLNNSNARDASSVLALSQGAEALLDKAHGSGVGNAIGGVQNFLGIESTKNQADAQLTALSGALVSKQPKMSGPQSDKDVLLYKQMAGDIGNASLPASVRKAALVTVREIAETYKNGYSATGYQGKPPSAGVTPTAPSGDYTGKRTNVIPQSGGGKPSVDDLVRKYGG